MIRTAAHGLRFAEPTDCFLRAGRCASRRGLGGLAVGLCIALAVVHGEASGQGTASPVRAEFRTPARPLIVQPVDRTRLVMVQGAIAGDLSQAQDLGARDPSLTMEHVQLILRRPAERQAAFDAQVEALHQRGGPSYHRWLTPEVIGAEFGPAPSDVAMLTSYLQGEGFTVDHVGRGGLYVDFTGTVDQVQRSFHTEIHTLRLANGEEHFSAVRDAEIPEALAPLVVGFAALGNLPTAHPNLRRAVPVSQRAVPSGLVGAKPLDDVSATNYAVGPQDFYTIYNEAPLLSASTPINGTGVTVALLEESAITTSDVTTFRTLYGVTPAAPVSLVVDTGYGSNSCTAPAKLKANGEEGEAILDIEWAGSVAPGANLIFMQCASSGSTLGVFLSAEAVIDNNLADVMSLSYGEYEGAYPPQDTLANDLWEQAAAQGETVVVSAGDTGPATEDGNLGNSYAQHGITMSSFSTPVWDVSAGGTDFQDTYNQVESDSGFEISNYWNSSNGPGLSSAKSYVPETTWNDTCASSIYNAYQEGQSADGATLCGATTKGNLYLVAGGGGPSKLYARPSWQNGTVYGLPSTASYPNRLEPDVSLFAANGFWYHSLPEYESDASGTSYAGGTSFVAPQLAGVFALIKQATGERLGQPDYVLYNMAGTEFGVSSYAGGGCNGSGASGIGTTSSIPSPGCIFYDVQTGNISVDCGAGTPDCYTLSGKSYGILSTSTTTELPAFPTNAGWDLATGIGSINIANLVNNWQNAAAGGALFTPTIGVTATAASYTYGMPSAITYKATVSGPGSFPTGSVTFSGSSTISTMGTDALVESSGCTTGGTCTESASQAYTPPGALAGGVYTISANYLSTNENYATGTGSVSLTVNPQTPTVTVGAVTIGIGTATANLTANVAFTGSGVAPSGGLTFQVDSGAVVVASCAGTSSPVVCSYSGYNTSSLAAGSHTITAVSLTDGNYAPASGSGTLSVEPLPTIVFTVPNHHTLDAPFTVSASSNSSGAITYSVVSGPATISGNSVTLTGVAGAVELMASQAASSGYAAGTQTATFSVAAGSIWFADAGGGLSVFDLSGNALSGSSGFTGGGVGTIAAPLGLAFDASGNMWVASSNGVSEFNRQGTPVTATALAVGGISSPEALAVDGAGQVWVANGNGTVSVLNNAGAAVSPASGYSGPGSTPAGIAIDTSGSVWIPSSTGSSVTRILGAAVPVVPLAAGAAGSPGVEP